MLKISKLTILRLNVFDNIEINKNPMVRNMPPSQCLSLRVSKKIRVARATREVINTFAQRLFPHSLFFSLPTSQCTCIYTREFRMEVEQVEFREFYEKYV